MQIIFKRYIPIKYLEDFVKVYEKGWDHNFPGCTELNYWLSILLWITDYVNCRFNYVCLAIDNDVCVGYLMASVAGKAMGCHPALFVINKVVAIILLLSRQGRGILFEHNLYREYMDKALQLGKLILAGKKKISVERSVAVIPAYRKSGIYREMTKRLFEKIHGYLIFHTSTESVYEAHERMGYKRLYTAPFPNSMSEGTMFIMYGDKTIVHLNRAAEG